MTEKRVSVSCNPILVHLSSKEHVENKEEEMAMRQSVMIPIRSICVEHLLCAENGYPSGGKLLKEDFEVRTKYFVGTYWMDK